MNTRLTLVALAMFLILGCSNTYPPYVQCNTNRDCANPSSGCFDIQLTREDGTEARGQFCSLECTSDVDCPDEGACIVLEGDASNTRFCAARCQMAQDCYVGTQCTGVSGGPEGLTLCLPE